MDQFEIQFANPIFEKVAIIKRAAIPATDSPPRVINNQ